MNARLKIAALGVTGVALVGAGTVVGPMAAGAAGTQSASLYGLQLLSKAAPLKAGKPTMIGIGVRTVDGKSHTGAHVCAKFPRSITVVRPLHGGRKAAGGKVCWPTFNAKPDVRILDASVRPRKAAKTARIVANLTAPDIVPATASWKIMIKR